MLEESQVGGWTLLREMGRGASAGVWLARSVADPEQHAALKILMAPEDSKERARLGREIEALRLLDHPAIVRHLEWGEDQDMMFLAMEAIEGPTLFERLQEDSPMPQPEVLRVFRALASAVEHAHAAGIAHCDLKPSNVLLKPDGSPCLVDFGIARLDEDSRLTQEGNVTGTLPYLAPEALDDYDIDRKASDIYALGVMLYRALTGRTGFSMDMSLRPLKRLTALLEAKKKGPLDPGSEFPQGIRRIVRDATHPDPRKRTSSAGAMAEAIDALSQTPSTMPNRVAADPPSNTPHLAVGAGVALLITALGLSLTSVLAAGLWLWFG